jgi:Flp pilus assembly protein TadG
MEALRRRKSRGLWGCERGAELVEFALVFPLMLLVVLGIIDWGLLFQRYEVLTNAAREGARVSVLPGYTSADITARVNQYLQGTSLSSATVTTTVGTAQALPIGSGTCVTVVPVTVAYVHTHTYLSGIGRLFGATFGTRTLTATAAMRSEIAGAACAGGS